MTANEDGIEVGIERQGAVGVVRYCRPPENYFSVSLIDALGDAFEALDNEPAIRCVVLAAGGRNFCAGAELARDEIEPDHLYTAAHRLFATRKPIVAAVQGAAIGGGMGLALVADFRVVAPSTRMAVNFVKIGIHPGFATSLLLPRLVGMQRATDLLYTGRRVGGEEAFAMGLADRLVEEEKILTEAVDLASRIAANAPLAVEETRATMRAGLLHAIAEQTAIEARKQVQLRETADFAEGVLAVAERRAGNWQRR